MTHVMTAPIARSAVGCCEECGYDLRGLGDNATCPECGCVSNSAVEQPRELIAWSRAVLAGLLLLLWITIAAISTVLIQPSTENFVGTTPSLNLPGPKLWAVPLLQRPIGPRPEEAGVLGTRTALLSLLALWLITAPCTAAGFSHFDTLRKTTRWVSVITFGLAFGSLTGVQELWPSQLPPLRALLVSGVELPGTALLYLYLRAIARQLPGRERRLTFDRLVIAVPIVIAAAAVMLGMQWVVNKTSGHVGNPTQEFSPQSQMFVASIYGAAAAICGVAASGAIGSLAVALAGVAMGRSSRLLAFSRDLLRQLAGRMSQVNWRAAGVAGGCVLLCIVMVLGNDRSLWISTVRLAGILPFVNFPGPKIWMIAPIVGRASEISEMISTCQFLMLNALAALLLTIQPTSDSQNRTLRLVVRWGAVLMLGTMVGVEGALSDGLLGSDPWGRRWIELVAVLQLICELPATLLLYWLFSQMAKELNRPALAKQFVLLTVAIIALVGSSVVIFALSIHYKPGESNLAEAVGSAFYGAIGLVAAVWATRCVLMLAWEYLKLAVQTKTAPRVAERFETVHVQVG